MAAILSKHQYATLSLWSVNLDKIILGICNNKFITLKFELQAILLHPVNNDLSILDCLDVLPLNA